MDIVILAGGPCDPDLREKTGVEWRADLVLGHRRLIDFVIDATQHLGELIVVSPTNVEVGKRVEPGKNFIGSLRNALEHTNSEDVLLVTGDIPFLIRADVDDFMRNTQQEVLLNYPIVRTEACEAQFPGMKRTAIRLREGRFTGGNIARINAKLFRDAMPTIEESYRLRKSPLKLAAKIGLGTLLNVILGQAIPQSLPLRKLESAVGKVLGGPVQAIITERAAIGTDIDDLAQYELAKSFESRLSQLVENGKQL